MKRRNFLKLTGLALITPLGIIKNIVPSTSTFANKTSFVRPPPYYDQFEWDGHHYAIVSSQRLDAIKYRGEE